MINRVFNGDFSTSMGVELLTSFIFFGRTYSYFFRGFIISVSKRSIGPSDQELLNALTELNHR